MAKDLISGLKGSMDGIFKIREDLGAIVRRVSFVTRKWSSSRIGNGSYIDDVVEMWPQPAIKDVSQDIRLMEGGVMKQGDLIIKYVSKNQYPNLTDVDGSIPDDSKNIERFMKVGDMLYTVVGVKEDYLTWNIHVRPIKVQGDAS